MAADFSYKIELACYRGSHSRWNPLAVISWKEKGSIRRQPVFGPDGVAFVRREQAERYAVELARSWIEKRELGRR